jgi:hypothetical protein
MHNRSQQRLLLRWFDLVWHRRHVRRWHHQHLWKLRCPISDTATTDSSTADSNADSNADAYGHTYSDANSSATIGFSSSYATAVLRHLPL